MDMVSMVVNSIDGVSGITNTNKYFCTYCTRLGMLMEVKSTNPVSSICPSSAQNNLRN